MNKYNIGYCFFLLPLFFYAQHIELSSPTQSLQVDPGTTTVLVFKAKNLSDEIVSFQPVLKLPESWALAVNQNTILLAPDQQKLLFFSVHIPQTTPKRLYAIPLVLFQSDTGLLVSTLSVTVQVAALKKIVLTPLDVPDFVKAGDAVHCSFIIKNEGNQQEPLLLQVENAMIEQGNSRVLEPRETQVLNVIKHTSGQLEKATTTSIKLTAFLKNNPDIKTSVYVHTKVIPVKEAREDIYHRFPVYLSGRYIGRDRNGLFKDGLQGELYGKGTLDKANTKHLEFRAVGPDRFSLSTFGQYEEYFIDYKSKSLSVHVGDKTYSSSYLTEFSRYGRGAEARLKINKLEVGGYYQRPRFFKAFKEQVHGFAAYNIDDFSFLKYGIVYNIMENKDDVRMMFFSAGTKLFKNLSVKSEYALSDSDTRQGNAFRVESAMVLPNLNASIDYLKANPDFEGFFTNTDFLAGNIHYRFAPKWNINVTYRKDARNFQQDTLYKVAPYNEQYTVGLSFQYQKRGSLLVYAGTQTRTDRLETKQYDYEEKFLRFNIIHRLGKLEFNVLSELANTHNKLEDYKGDSYLNTLNLTLNQGHNIFTLFGSYLNTTRYSPKRQELFYYGARINGQFSGKTTCSAFYQNSYSIEESYRDRNLMEAQVHQKITPSQTLSLVGRYSLAQGELKNKDLSFSVRYTLRLNVPVSKIANYGALNGSIQNLGVSKVEGIKLYLNNREAVTDALGKFSFVNVPPGDYYLEIDRKSIGFQDIPDIVLPARVEILSDKTASIAFGLTKAASIQGRLNIHKEDDNLSLKDNSKERVIVEISNGKDVYRKLVDADAVFNFTYLRPGNWQAKIYRNGLDKKYRIQTTQYDLHLYPGGKEFINIEVTKQQQKVKYLQKPMKLIKNIKPKK